LDKRGTTIDDLARFRIPSDPQISPDGTRVAFVVKTTDLEKNAHATHIWVVAADGDSTPRQWTHGTGSEADPRWSPDGKYLAFTSGREEKKAQLFLLPTEGGEAERVTDFPAGSIGEFRWSPDGSRIAFTFRPQDETWREEAFEERKKAKKSSPPREITRRRFRTEGEGFLPSTPYHLHILNVATRRVEQITDGDRDDGPFCWSPDGTVIAFVRNTAPDPDLLPSARCIFVIPAEKPADGYAEPTMLAAPEGPKSGLAWSPDGRYLAFLGHDDPNEIWGIRNVHAWIVPVEGGEPAHDLTPGWDVHGGNVAMGDTAGGGENGPCWSADNRSLLFLASERGAVDVHRVSRDGGTPLRLTEGRHAVLGFTADRAGDRLALLLATPSDAGDIYLMSERSAPRRMTELNQDLLTEVDLPAPIVADVPLAGGGSVPCWFVPPPGFADDPTPRPAVLYIHGGPHLMYAHTLFHEYAALAAAGYTVIFPNPRGSKGYGEEWAAAIRGDWGAPAMPDCLACVDYAIQQGWADGNRLGVAGGSYGGYLTAWTIGHTDRFKAAVAERGVYNLLSMAGTCDFPWRDRDYFDATTTDDIAEYHRNSPLTYAGNIRTPLLLLHGEGDLRCPVSQAEEMFSALKMRGRDVLFVRYGPEASHNQSRTGPPDIRLDRQHRIHAWFDKHLKPTNDLP
jgi:acylaminoacyl-peptidase